MKNLFTAVLFFTCTQLSAQKETYDITSFSAPKGWKKEQKETVISYSSTDQKTGSWAVINIVKSTVSKGSIDADFSSEWNELIVKTYSVKEAPETNEILEADGWKIKSGGGKFTFNKADAIALLTTFSGYSRCASIVALTNSQDYLQQIQDFLASIDLSKTKPITENLPAEKTKPVTNGFAFNITNFDDGWTSTEQADWVEVEKGKVKVLLHYPKDGTIFPADPEPLTNAAWNILVAPRYSNLKNYRTAYISTYNRPYLGFGDATENASGKEVFIVFFRQGDSGWIEFVAPDKSTFIQSFGFDPYDIRWDSNSDVMNPLARMTNYNKFAIAATDFKGTWTSDFSGVQQLYSVYTGQYAGMNINQSNETFQFGAGNTYNWKLLVVNGLVGNMNYAEVKSSGKFTVLNNWQISFSKIENKARKYHAYFKCIKGARLLLLLDADYPGSGIYTVFGKK
jgi:hypothetical protein